MSYFRGLLAEVIYNPVKADQVKRVFPKKKVPWEAQPQKVECFSYRLKKDEVLPNPIFSNPKFWQEEVLQLSFALEDGKEEKIINFFHKYGSISPPVIEGNKGTEEVKKLREYLLFFRELTNWVRWLKEERIEALWDHIKEGQRIFNAVALPTTPEAHYFPETPPGVVEIEYPIHYHYDTIPKKSRLVPFCWQTAAQAAARYLEAIPLVPEAKDGIIFFRFKARCALDAAFLQWYFQEFTSYRTCAAKGCENPVFGRADKKYCSRKCKLREKQRRHRERRKESQESVAGDAKK